MTELLPCPFCGVQLTVEPGKPVPSVRHPTDVECLLSGHDWWLVPSFIAAWNRRAPVWQPIATAPKDGKLVILFDGDAVSVGVFTDGGWRFWNGETEDGYRGNIAGSLNYWLSDYGPTHWKPLPAPPQEPTNE